MKRHLILSLGAALLALALMPGGALAQSRPLPAFTVVSATGVVVSSSQLHGAGRWLLVYVAPDAVTSERLLRSLEEWVATDGARVVVIVAGDTPAAQQIRSLPAPSAAAVYADPDGNAARALGVSSVPALAGVASGALDWLVQGVLNDPRMVEPIVRSWLGGRQ